MSFFLRITDFNYTWPSQEYALFENLNLTLESGWTGLVGPNGCGKSTLLRLIAGELNPYAGRLDVPGTVLLCEQRTDEPPDGLADLLCYPDAASGRLASLLHLESDWPWRWDTLSHGERKRAQIAEALWKDPDVLLADEPANHLDAQSRELLSGALSEYRGIGLIVSHDRSLLDCLCGRTLFLDEKPVRLRPGGVSAGLEERGKEDLRNLREFEASKRELKRLEEEARRRAQKVAADAGKNSKKKLDAKDSDMRFKIDTARILGRDGKAGRLKTRMDGRVEAARERVASASLRRNQEGGITIAGRRSSSDRVAELPAGRTDFGGGRGLEWPDLIVGPEDRIAVEGPNGAGKSRLIGLLLEASRSMSAEILSIPQELPEDAGRDLMKRIGGLSREEKGAVFSAVDRLGSDPVRLMSTESPSPGETRKLILALGLARSPEVIVMDEPTNHMDLFSVRHLETALSGFPGALILVSHDKVFLEALTETEWRIVPEGAGGFVGRLDVRSRRNGA